MHVLKQRLVKMGRPRVWAWVAIVLLIFRVLTSVGLVLLAISWGLLPPVAAQVSPQAWTWLVGLVSDTVFFVVGAGAVALGGFYIDRVYWQNGARWPIRTVDEGRVLLNLTPEESRELEDIQIHGPTTLVGATLMVIAAAAFLLFDVLAPLDFAALIALAVICVVWQRKSSKVVVAKYEYLLLNSEYARKHRLTPDHFKGSRFAVFRSASLYRQIIPQIDRSPFEVDVD